MKTETIKQTVTFNASPHEVYELIMDSAKHSSFTGSKVTMNKKIKGNFDAFDGYVHGYNIELVQDTKIVQAWHFSEEGWDPEHYSICTFEFERAGDKTRLIFTQQFVPESTVEDLKKGWKEFYWSPMKAWLNKEKRIPTGKT
jgi:activator of HSP90 ATPase